MIYFYILLGCALALYILSIAMYFSKYNLFRSNADFRKFIIGPFIIFFVYGLLRSKIIGNTDDEEQEILYGSIVLALSFVIFYGVTKIITNNAMSVNGVLVENQFNERNYI
tara:strand:+ start:14 stop:346 length:333 start_codon:yes stop_codon:yes gene_type:complete